MLLQSGLSTARPGVRWLGHFLAGVSAGPHGAAATRQVPGSARGKPFRGRAARHAGSRSLRRWLTTAVTPSPRILTPYSASATSIVRLWCVTTISWELSLSS